LLFEAVFAAPSRHCAVDVSSGTSRHFRPSSLAAMGAGMPVGIADCAQVEEHIGRYESLPSVLPRGTPVGNTAIVFDWDDTLLCSSAVRMNACNPKQLEELERQIAATLQTAMALGETLIVTNGVQNWVMDSARSFFPGLVPLLRKLPVISARALCEEAFPDDPFMWKRECFDRLFLRERAYPADRGLNLIALGDQYPELDAAKRVVQVLGGPSTVKTLKFKEQPSIPELIGQLCKAEAMMAKLVSVDESGSFGLFLRRDEFYAFTEQANPASPASWKVLEMVPQTGCGAACGGVCPDPAAGWGLRDVLHVFG